MMMFSEKNGIRELLRFLTFRVFQSIMFYKETWFSESLKHLILQVADRDLEVIRDIDSHPLSRFLLHMCPGENQQEDRA